MTVPDPKAVRELLTRYAALRIAQSERERLAVTRELTDVSRLLCELMDTAEVPEAIARADVLLSAVPGARRAPAGGDAVPIAV
ncbi:DUF5133 domain-containing protein [Streptomyces sp. NPDC059477]|uniref:DUF5133 domain-containing protein n=1 Tax=Streptomyces sp. NPDC059477 TaxID=3346847 RepID=UPI0036C48241